MAKGDNNPNGKRMNLAKKRRQSKQQMKKIRGITANEVVKATNSQIAPLEDLVVEATQKHQQTLLLADKPYNEVVNKIKIVTAIRPGRIGKHGITTRPTRINKKKVKKMIRKANLKESILKKVRESDSVMN